MEKTAILNLQKPNISYTLRKLNRAELYEVIKQISPCSIYKLSKATGEAYKTIWYAIRDLEFAGVIITKMKEINGRMTRVISIPKSHKRGRNEETD